MSNSFNAEKFRLTILLVTYNQERFIRQAMESILQQEFEGKIELIVADDTSTDRTPEIIREYDGRDSRFLFRYLERTGNLGGTKNYQRGFAACSGDYIAIMEGDDYWSSPLKLRRQADFLGSHRECDLCAVNFHVLDESNSQMYPRTPAGSGYRYISARDLIADNIVSNFSTCMYRKSALDSLPEGLFEISSYDWIVNICVARNSMIGYLEEPMSVYRLHAQGIWTQMTQLEQLKAQLELLAPYDALTEGVFHDEFEALKNRLEEAIAQSESRPEIKQQRKPGAGAHSAISGLLPPVVVNVLRSLLSPRIKRFVARTLHRSRE